MASPLWWRATVKLERSTPSGGFQKEANTVVNEWINWDDCNGDALECAIVAKSRVEAMITDGWTIKALAVEYRG